MLDEHYAHLSDKPFFVSLKKYMMTPVVGMVLEGIEAVDSVRKIVGSTNPRAADAGTIRADLSMNVPSNLVHASIRLKPQAQRLSSSSMTRNCSSTKKFTDRFIFGEGI